MIACEIKSNGVWTGATSQIASSGGLAPGWVRVAAAPVLSAGQYAVFAGDRWVITTLEPPSPPAISTSEPSGAASVYSDLSSNDSWKGAELVTFNPQIPSSIPRPVAQKLRDSVSVMDFMTPAQRADVIAGTKLLDVSDAINAAIAAVGNNGEVFFPPYEYRVSQTIQMPSNRHWQKLRGSSSPEAGGGAGVRSKLDFSQLPPNMPAIVTGGRSIIENIGIFGPGASVGGTSVGVKVDYESNLRNVVIHFFDVGCAVAGCFYTKLRNTYFRFCSLGLRAENFHNLNVVECAFAGGVPGARTTGQSSGNGVLLLSGGECSIRGGSFEAFWGAGGYGIKALGNFLHLNVSDAYFEAYGDETHQSGPAILIDGVGTSVNVKGCYSYIYYQDAFVWLSDDTWKYTLTSIGNRFTNSSTYGGMIYRLPANEGYRKTGTIFIAGDNMKDIGSVKPLYISPDILNATNGHPNTTIYPPRYGFAAGSKIPDHEFIGRPQVQYVLDAPPSAPIKGVVYWANGSTWNPFASAFAPYPVVFDGGQYQQVVRPSIFSSANNTNITLKPNENVVCLTDTSSVTVTLPASPQDGDIHVVKATGGANAVTIVGSGVTVEGSPSIALQAGTYQSCRLCYSQFVNQWLVS